MTDILERASIKEMHTPMTSWRERIMHLHLLQRVCGQIQEREFMKKSIHLKGVQGGMISVTLMTTMILIHIVIVKLLPLRDMRNVEMVILVLTTIVIMGMIGQLELVEGITMTTAMMIMGMGIIVHTNTRMVAVKEIIDMVVIVLILIMIEKVGEKVLQGGEIIATVIMIREFHPGKEIIVHAERIVNPILALDLGRTRHPVLGLMGRMII